MGIADNDFAAEQQGYFSLVSRLSALIQRGFYHSGWFRKGRTMRVLNPYQADIPQDTVVEEAFNFVFALKAFIEMISVRTGTRGSQ